MQFSTIFLPLIAALGTSAAALPDHHESRGSWTWEVTDYSTTVSSGGTATSCTVTGHRGDNRPRFVAHCYSTSYDHDFVDCRGTDSGKHMQYWWFDGKAGPRLQQNFRLVLPDGRVWIAEGHNRIDGDDQPYNVTAWRSTL